MLGEVAGEVGRLVEDAVPKVDIPAEAIKLSESVWSETGCGPSAAEAMRQQLSDAAWGFAEDAGAAAEGAAEAAKNTAYVGGRTALGVGRLGENAVKTVRSMAVYAMGDQERAAEIARESVVDGVADALADAMQVDDEVREVGDMAEVVGEVAGGIAISVATPAGAATAAAEAVFALGTAGEVLDKAAQDGELNDGEVAQAAATGAASAALGVVADKVVGKVAEKVVESPLGRAVASRLDDVAKSFAKNAGDVTEAAAEQVDNAAVAVADKADDVSRAVFQSGDEVGETAAREVAHAAEASADDVAEGIASEADDVARATDDVAEASAKASVDAVADSSKNTENAAEALTNEADEISSEVRKAVDDVKSFSECPETISDDVFDLDNLEVKPPEAVKTTREEFNRVKDDLISEWESKMGLPWPTYAHDVYSPNGYLIRKAGQRFDAHHVQPLKLGGKNVAENITPMHVDVHYDSYGVHASDGPYEAIFKMLEGAARG